MMVNESQSSDLVDPFGGYSSAPLLFPQTFRASTTATKPKDQDDIDSIHAYLKSLALSSPHKLLEQARTIVNNGPELLNSKLSSYVASKDKNEALATVVMENPRERRPALGRKRPQFSLKLDSSQLNISLEPSLDIDQLQDPEEYFLAHEKLENAKKEIWRQTGNAFVDLNQHKPSMNARRRRPGLLGRSASYRHRYSSVVSDKDENFISSQETFEQDICSPYNCVLPENLTNLNDASQEEELADSTVEAERKVDRLLDELLSNKCEDLDGNVAFTLLQDRLQIKPIDVDRLCLPDLHDTKRSEVMVSRGSLPKRRNVLLDVQNVLKGMSCKTPVMHKQIAESPVHPLASPTPPKSPLASISLLKKRILQQNTSVDPFSALNIDLSPASNSSPVGSIHNQSNHIDCRKNLSVSEESNSLMVEADDTTAANMGTEGSGHPFDNYIDHSLNRLETEAGDKVEDMTLGAVPSARPDIDVEDSTAVKLHSSCGQLDQSSPAASEPDATDAPAEISGSGPEQQIKEFQEPSVEALVKQSTANKPPSRGRKKKKFPQRQSLADQSIPAASEPNAMGGPANPPDICAEQHLKEPSVVALGEQSKANTPPCRRHKRMKFSQRQSLAGAGASWEAGVRRSTRIRMRPLEYWKGERFLYGRVHQSLATVIGLKYVSPAKGEGKPTMKVKSYVSDEYKELVELAALH
ncbi:centromere protein C [Malania oleifera]|uniref:centromere protein C n=1 Tax=Malania oleifera TaxID=397392 RepID=UPI0025AE039E|nr:centromere protein C [Malania oleifera]